LIRLHDFTLSSAGYRVRIALNLKGIAYESRSYALRKGEQRSADYRAINPACLVPTLEIDGLVLTQSLAIVDYLDATHPEPHLVPREPAERARVLALAFTLACDVHPLNNLRVLLYLEKQLGADEAARTKWIAEWTAPGLAAVEAMLRARPETAFAMGEEPGLADICLAPQIFHARRYHVDLAPYPRVVAAVDRAATHPAFARAAPVMPPPPAA
jgi:maleylacetoacetate isomerase/maleylpyruvate isomerase